jgi:hypothetical protein
MIPMIKKTIFLLFTSLSFQSLVPTCIHVFGDSHASFFFSNERTAIPRNEQSYFDYDTTTQSKKIEFRINWFGSKTMHSVARDGLNALDIKNFGVQEEDVAVFVFGEIDARCHVGKQRDNKHRDLDEIIETLARNFMKTIQLNKSPFNNLHIVIVSIMPPTNNAFNESYPYHGTLEDRVLITQALNARLCALCIEYQFDFLDLYTHYANNQGFLDNDLSDGVVHVNQHTNDAIKKQLIDLLAQRHGLFNISQQTQ